MEVLVINCGSSSLKFQLIDSDSEKVLAKGICERIGIKGSVITYQPTGGEKELSNIDMPTHHEAIDAVIKALTNKETGVINDMSEVKAVGHRVVHGGEYFSKATLVDDDVIKKIEECNYLAPLHNPANIIGIKACMKLMPDTPNVVVFDTAFHQTMPPKAYMYPLPYEYYEKYNVRRYGFHGTSHRYVSKRAIEMLGNPEHSRVITCHLGNGSSIAAVKDGKCIDTSMGLTPLAGFEMGTRCGDIDPAIVPYLMKKENLTPDEIDTIMNKKSGLLGVTGISSDYRDAEAAMNEGNERAKLGIDMFRYQIAKYIGSYVVALGGCDAIVFTAGIGENNGGHRAAICEYLECLGVKIDPEKNKLRGDDIDFTGEGSTIKTFIIPTDEELMIAQDTMELLSK